MTTRRSLAIGFRRDHIRVLLNLAASSRRIESGVRSLSYLPTRYLSLLEELAFLKQPLSEIVFDLCPSIHIAKIEIVSTDYDVVLKYGPKIVRVLQTVYFNG
jgi:hypothetical protein